jgi:hypothetical protein
VLALFKYLNLNIVDYDTGMNFASVFVGVIGVIATALICTIFISWFIETENQINNE